MKPILFALLLVFTASSCTGNLSESNFDQVAMDMTEDLQLEKKSNQTGLSRLTSNDQQQKESDRKLIRRASLHLEVQSYGTARKELDQIVGRFGAYVDSENERKNLYSLENTLVIRVLPDSFEGCIAALEQLALNVNNKSINTEDVTRQYVDLETRLASKRAVVAQYQSLLQKAQSIKDILAVEEQLRVVTEEIESTEAQLRYLSHQVGWSTIEVTLVEPLEGSPVARKSFASRVGSAFRNGWSGLVEFTIALVSVWPFLLIASVLLYFVRSFWSRRKNRI